GRALGRPDPLLRVLPRRQRRRARRKPPDGLDGAGGEAAAAERGIARRGSSPPSRAVTIPAVRLRLTHWREYAAEALGLGLFMVAACSSGVALGHPESPVVGWSPEPFPRRALMGLAMGLTAILLIRSPWGQRSGAHLNPATTLTFW